MMISDSIENSFGLTDMTVDKERLAAKFSSEFNVGMTGFYDNEVLGCAGIIMPWRHVGIAWALISQKGREHKFFVHRAVKFYLYQYIQRLQLRRVEANVIADLNVARRWARSLGFREESMMIKYGPNGETYMRYVMFP